MYASINIMKRSPQMRKKYVKDRIEEDKVLFYGRLTWDSLNIALIIVLLYSTLVMDGMQLTSNLKGMAPSSFQGKDNQCQFTLFPICLFADLVNACSFDV